MTTLKHVLSELQGRRDFHGVGIQGGYLEAVLFERAWKGSWHRSGRKGISSKGKMASSVTEVQTWSVYARRGFPVLVRNQLEALHCRWLFLKTLDCRGHIQRLGRVIEANKAHWGLQTQQCSGAIITRGSSMKDPAESWSPGRGLSHGSWGWEACDHCQRRGSKAERDGKKHPDFFPLLCLCQCLRGQTQQNVNKQGTLDDRPPASASR